MKMNTEPLDRTRREHVGVIRSIRDFNGGGGDTGPATERFIVAELTDGCVVKGTAAPSSLTPGIRFRFIGRWGDHPKYGPQFAFDSFVPEAPVSRSGAVKYLCDIAPNVGTKTAERLWDRYGGECVKILRESPGKVQEDGIMGLDGAVEASVALAENAALEGTTIELSGLLAGYGFHLGRLIPQAITKPVGPDLPAWGARAPSVIRRNPFSLLLRKMPGAGFKRCDKLYCNLKLPKGSIKRQFFCAWNFLRTAGNGHTWFRAEEVMQAIASAMPSEDVNPNKALRLGKRIGWLRTRCDEQDRVWVAESAKARNEQLVADNLQRLMAWKGDRLWPFDLPISIVDGDGLPSDHQREQAIVATTGPVGILCGGPGTGKTHTLSFILREVIKEIGAENVAVVAPTGKAAVRASQSLALRGVNVRATTIHRLLEIGRNGHDGDGWGFQRNRGNPLGQRVIICDETSMNDVDIMAALLEACADGTHVLFIGDPDQLPPVGHGAPLRDMIEAKIPTGKLLHVRRNAGQIVHACVRIRNGEQFEYSDHYDPECGKNLLHIETESEEATLETLDSLLASMKVFHPVWSTAVLVGINVAKSQLYRTAVNDRMRALLNPDGYAVEPNPFRVGDKVICLRNGTCHAVWAHDGTEQHPLDAGSYTTRDPSDEFGSGEPVEVYVANGEIGKVEAVGASAMIVRVGESDQLVKVNVGKQRKDDGDEDEGGGGSGGGDDKEGAAKGRGCNWDLAYAVTVHKSQGSESPCVIVLVDPAASRVADRSWWYTGISRASKLCITIGAMATINKQRMRQSLVKRKTFLQQLIEEGRKHGESSKGGGDSGNAGTSTRRTESGSANGVERDHERNPESNTDA